MSDMKISVGLTKEEVAELTEEAVRRKLRSPSEKPGSTIGLAPLVKERIRAQRPPTVEAAPKKATPEKTDLDKEIEGRQIRFLRRYSERTFIEQHGRCDAADSRVICVTIDGQRNVIARDDVFVTGIAPLPEKITASEYR